MNKRFYNLEEAIQYKLDSDNIFILSNEFKKKNDKIGRYYLLFSDFNLFLKNRNNYPHCHEILVDHINNKPNNSGRLVFDFDIKTKISNEYPNGSNEYFNDSNENLNDSNSSNEYPNSFDKYPNDSDKYLYGSDEYPKDIKIPHNFKNQIEDTIIETIERFYINVNLEKINFIWSTCENKNKFSKHLTVKNFYFDDWIEMSKIFYKLFSLVWEELNIWILSKDLVDFQIIRRRASLRMVGSSKINGNILKFDNINHKLEDSLIRIYNHDLLKNEQIITKNNIINGVLEKYFKNDNDIVKNKIINSNININKLQNYSYEYKIYEKAYKLFCKIQNDVFILGKINNIFACLIRIKPSKCLISDKKHENENAYLEIIKDINLYNIYYGCYRKCGKNIYIGSITLENNLPILSGFFEKKIL